jgi:hypothetical protein
MSTYRMLADLGYVVGPVLLGILTDLAGADVALASSAAAMLAMAALFAWRAPETYRAAR